VKTDEERCDVGFLRLVEDHPHRMHSAIRTLQYSSLVRTSVRARSHVACSDRKGLIFLMLYKANLQDQGVVVLWSVKLN